MYELRALTSITGSMAQILALHSSRRGVLQGLQHTTCAPPHAAVPQDYEIDFISLSYTRSVDDVVEARAFLDAVGLQNTKIFAKLESRQSLLNFKGILNEADGIIISRCVHSAVVWQCWIWDLLALTSRSAGQHASSIEQLVDQKDEGQEASCVAHVLIVC